MLVVKAKPGKTLTSAGREATPNLCCCRCPLWRLGPVRQRAETKAPAGESSGRRHPEVRKRKPGSTGSLPPISATEVGPLRVIRWVRISIGHPSCAMACGCEFRTGRTSPWPWIWAKNGAIGKARHGGAAYCPQAPKPLSSHRKHSVRGS